MKLYSCSIAFLLSLMITSYTSFAMENDNNEIELEQFESNYYKPLIKPFNPINRKKSPFSSAYAFGGILIGTGLGGAGSTYFADELNDHQNALYGIYFTSVLTGVVIYLATSCFDTCQKTFKGIKNHLKQPSQAKLELID